jgi:hypothetical protein
MGHSPRQKSWSPASGYGSARHYKRRSNQEAIEWVKRCPNPMPDGEAEIEIRQVFEAEDFGPALTPELREQEERLRSHVEQRTGS